MRGIVENTIRNMSPEDRQEALETVTRQVVSMMSEQERLATLRAIVAELSAGMPPERIAAALAGSGEEG